MSSKISICSPFYNAGCYTGEAKENVLAQTFSSFKFLLLNDGSSDNSMDVVNWFASEYIRCIQCGYDYIKSLNTGLDLSQGKYSACMDATIPCINF